LEKEYLKKYSALNLKANLDIRINSELLLNANFKIEENIEDSHLGLSLKYSVENPNKNEHNFSLHLNNDYLLKFNADYALDEKFRINLGLVKNNQSEKFPYPYFNVIFDSSDLN